MFTRILLVMFIFAIVTLTGCPAMVYEPNPAPYKVELQGK